MSKLAVALLMQTAQGQRLDVVDRWSPVTCRVITLRHRQTADTTNTAIVVVCGLEFNWLNIVFYQLFLPSFLVCFLLMFL